MQRNLSFDQTPPLSVPLRFFLSAPLFSFAAGLLLLWQGPPALLTRWAPATLALTHLMTLGVLVMSMCGALIQILPVVAGIAVARARLTATVVHAALSAGTVLLVTAFCLAQALLFKLALGFLGLAFGWMLCALALGLWRALAPGAAALVAAIRMAVLSLLFTALLGAMLGAAFAWPLALPLTLLTDLHVMWGLGGWVCLQVAGVAFQVVPMFLVTPLYPAWVTRRWASTLFVLLVLRSLVQLSNGGLPDWLGSLLSAVSALALMAFATVTLYLLWCRKRPQADAATLFWRTAMASLLGCAALWLFAPVNPHAEIPIALGVLFILGFGYSAINGMLYKIVPFLIWYHLQHTLAGGCATVPSVKKIIPEPVAIRQFWSHLGTLLLSVVAAVRPESMARVAACALCLSSGWLVYNLFGALRVHRRIARLAQPS